VQQHLAEHGVRQLEALSRRRVGVRGKGRGRVRSRLRARARVGGVIQRTIWRISASKASNLGGELTARSDLPDELPG